jgi:hypothetical protein
VASTFVSEERWGGAQDTHFKLNLFSLYLTDYNQGLLPWKRGRGYGIVTVDIAFNIAWCTTSDLNIFINVNGRDDTWVNVLGALTQISIGESGVWGVYTTGAIYNRVGITASNPSGTIWYQDISGLLVKITSGRPGKQN